VVTLRGTNLKLAEPNLYQLEIVVAEDDKSFTALRKGFLKGNSFKASFKLNNNGLSSLSVKIVLKKSERKQRPLLISQKSLKMFEDPQFSDFKFIVKGKEFKVHRAMLCHASPVFAKLFTADMEEIRNNECVVNDIDPKIFKYLLRFIYGEVLPQDLKLVCVKLYEAAHYYEIEELKEVCIDEISQSIAKDNAVKMYNWACLYEVEMVKDVVMAAGSGVSSSK
jgi:hypothetical protein